MASSSGSNRRRVNWANENDGFGDIIPVMPSPPSPNMCVCYTIKLVMEVRYRVNCLNAGNYSEEKRNYRADAVHLRKLLINSPIRMDVALKRLIGKSIKAENLIFPWPYKLEEFRLLDWDDTSRANSQAVNGLLGELEGGPLIGLLTTDSSYHTTSPPDVWKFDETKPDPMNHCLAIVGLRDKPADDGHLVFIGVEESKNDDECNRIIFIHSTSFFAFFAPVLPVGEPQPIDIITAIKKTVNTASTIGKIVHGYESCYQHLQSENEWLEMWKLESLVADVHLCILAQGYDHDAVAKTKDLCRSLRILILDGVCSSNDLAESIGEIDDCYCLLITNLGEEIEEYAYICSEYAYVHSQRAKDLLFFGFGLCWTIVKWLIKSFTLLICVKL